VDRPGAEPGRVRSDVVPLLTAQNFRRVSRAFLPNRAKLLI
jgi:hypothetical protein